jgi:hypothetical protein
MSNPTCEERIDKELEYELQRIRDALRLSEIFGDGYGDYIDPQTVLELRRIWTLGRDEAREAFDLIKRNEGETVEGWQQYLDVGILYTVVRVQMSTGGPGDEFEVYIDPNDGEIVKIIYRFLDWFDGAERELRGDDFEKIREAVSQLYPIYEIIERAR